jgi:hypothetical protein
LRPPDPTDSKSPQPCVEHGPGARRVGWHPLDERAALRDDHEVLEIDGIRVLFT